MNCYMAIMKVKEPSVCEITITTDLVGVRPFSLLFLLIQDSLDDYEGCGGTCNTAASLGTCEEFPGGTLTFRVRISSGAHLAALLTFEEGRTYYVISKLLHCLL